VDNFFLCIAFSRRINAKGRMTDFCKSVNLHLMFFIFIHSLDFFLRLVENEGGEGARGGEGGD